MYVDSLGRPVGVFIVVIVVIVVEGGGLAWSPLFFVK